MAGRKKTKKATGRSIGCTRVIKKSARRKEASGRFSEYFRINESYTSLILGIVVVIIASVLLISFLRGREFKNTPPPAPEISSAKIEPDATLTPVSEQSVTSTVQPIVTEQIESPTVPSSPKANFPQAAKGTYIVQPGDDLWKIAQKQYKDGYKWTIIAKENNITNPGMIFSGNVLKIPAAEEAPVVTSAPSTEQQQPSGQPVIVGNTYTIKHGDTLWDIAQRRYKNGYRWVDIAKANNLANPDIIHSDNVLQLPN